MKDYKKDTRTVILFGNNNQNTLGKARSFGDAGFEPILIWVRPRYNLVKHCKYVNHWYNVDTYDEGINLLLDKFANESSKTLVSVEGDGIIAAMDSKYDTLKKYFIFYNAGSQGRLSYYMKKANLIEAAKEVGLRIPKTEEIRVGDLPRSLSYPVITKAADSFDIGGKLNTHICNTPEELREAFKSIKSKKIIVQEYVRKKNELMLQGVSINGGDEVFVPIEGSFYRLPKDAYGSFGFFEEYHEGDKLYNKLKKLLQLVRFSGVFETEFIISENNELFFLEINFRDTMWNHAFTEMGVNLNKIWADSEMAGHLVSCESIIARTKHLFMHEFVDFNRYVKSKEISLSEWFKDFHRTNTCMEYDRTDIMPFLVHLWMIFLKRLERLGLAKKGAHMT